LYDLFETHFGIHDHSKSSKTKPLSSVALHECEDNTETSLIYKAVERYTKLKINQLFGLNLIEFLSLPKEYCEKLMLLAIEHAKQNTNTLNEIQNSLNNPK
jgi:hypothetical protein